MSLFTTPTVDCSPVPDLPVELLVHTIRELPREDLLSVCQTSRLLNLIATRTLYSAIQILETAQLENVLGVLDVHEGDIPPRARHLRILDIALDDDQE